MTTDAIVWMLQVAAPELGVRHGSETKTADTHRFLLPFIEAATVYGSRTLILEGDALGPGTAFEIARLWPQTRAVFLGAGEVEASDITLDGGYASELDQLNMAALVDYIRRRSRGEHAECDEFGIAWFDVSGGREDILDRALRALRG